MIRYGRRYEVIPVVERVVEDDLSSESVTERLMNLPLCFIHLVHNLRQDFQPLLCHGTRRPAAGIGDGEEGCPAPGACYLGEKAVLDGVELGTVRRVVHDENLHADAVGEVHEVLLDNMVPAGVGPAAVAEDDEHPRIRVEPSHVAVPYTLYVVAHELGRVVACAYREVSRVARDVVDALRHNPAPGEGLEIVVVGVGRGGAVHRW